MTDLTGHSLGRYRLTERLGEGGMATVYKAYDTRLETDVAVKVIRTENILPRTLDQSLKRFEREAKSLAKLTHTNIVKVSDYGEYEGKPYLVMPYLPGGTLKQRLGKPITWQEAMNLLLPIAKALEFAHSQNMIHRDVKPSNILLTQSGTPMLTDFGIAKILDMDETQDLTGTGAAVGTPEYMAPEQWTGRTSTQSDQYGLGIVLYEMVTGRKPYTADTPAAILLKQANDPLPRPGQFVRDLPEKVEKLLMKVLAKDPADRYPCMGDFASAMESALAGIAMPVAGRPVGSRERKPDTMTTLDQGREGSTIREPFTRTEQAVTPVVSAGLLRYWPVGLVGILIIVGSCVALILSTLKDGGGNPNIPSNPPQGPISNPLPGGQDVTVSPTPTLTVTPSITPSATYTPTPTVTPTPTSALADPAGFIRWYFTSIWSDRNYWVLWSEYQTAAFRKSSAKNDYQGFVDYYNTVQRIDVSSVNLLQNNGRTALVEVVLVYYMKAGWSDTHTFEFKLTFDQVNGHWMFETNK